MDDSSSRYDQEFFLHLARPEADTDEARAAAQDRWNAWRRDPANKNVEVTFEGVDFRLPENAGISFAGFEFGDSINFQECRFCNHFDFSDCVFGRDANFNRALFGTVEFDRSNFGAYATFVGACFGVCSSFVSTKIGPLSRFMDTDFCGYAKFDFMKVGSGCWFENAIFGPNTSFNRVIFEGVSIFHNCMFSEGVTYENSVFLGPASFVGKNFEGWVDYFVEMRSAYVKESSVVAVEFLPKILKRRIENHDLSPNAFHGINFSGCVFVGIASFSGRHFDSTANFTSVQFHQPPDFVGATNLQRIDLTGARVGFVPPGWPRLKPHWTEDSNVPIRLRAFRAVAEQTKNHDLERDLYIEERKAERGVYAARHARAEPVRAFQTLSGMTAAKLSFSREIGARRFAAHGVVTWRDARARQRLVRRLSKHVRRDPGAIARWATHWSWIAVMGVYWALSDYGRSLIRPPVWLVVTLPLFYASFDASLATRRGEAAADAARISAAASPPRPAEEAYHRAKRDYFAATRQLAISNTIPFVGPLSIDSDVKKFLLCGKPLDDAQGLKSCVPIAPRGYQATLIAQNLFAALLAFFFGLALRNYFKVK